MSRRSKHPLPAGSVVFPRQWFNAPVGGLQQDVEGRATITDRGNSAHHYLVTFEGETEAVERGPLDEASTREELAV